MSLEIARDEPRSPDTSPERKAWQAPTIVDVSINLATHKTSGNFETSNTKNGS